MAQGIITTLAGTGSCSYSGDGGPATAATLCNAQTPATDAAGNIYFADQQRIRRVGTDGVITAIAGNGVYGSSGDGGPALSASIGYVRQIAAFGSHVCFGDSTAYKIRCVELNTGLIHGWGTGSMGTGGDGGIVTAASFSAPYGFAFDDAGNMYVSDFSGNSVRRIDVATGTITMFAGPGPGYCCLPLGDGGPAVGANIYQPMGIYYRNGGLYIADTGNNRVRRVDLATGIIATVAGNGSPYYTAGMEGGSALQAGIGPWWIALDQAGNLFINGGRKVDTYGIITTIAGKPGESGYGLDDVPSLQTVFSGINGIGWDAVANRLLISDGGSRIRQIYYTPPTTTTLTSSVNPAIPGSQVILQATVSPVMASGIVRFRQNETLVGTAPVVNGVANFTWTAPFGGYYTNYLRAIYGGDANDNLSASATIGETEQQGTTTTTITSSANPAVQGQNIAFTITVSPVAATGPVYLLNGQMNLASGTLSNGTATFNVSNLPVGSNSINAYYQNSPSYFSSVAPTLIQVVRPATTTSLTASPNPSAYGNTVTLTAAVAPAGATGSVQFFNGATALGAANLVSGQAQLSLTNLPIGAASLTAVYGGDVTYGGSTSAAVAQTVTIAPSSVTLTSSLNPSTNGQSVTFTATVSPSFATGTVTFQDGSTVVGPVTISGGSAAVTLSSLTVGDHSIAAGYNGDANVAPSVYSVLTQTIGKAPTTVTLTASPNPAMEGQTVTLTAVVSPGTATGLVQFFEGAAGLGTVTMSGGSASLTLSAQTYAFSVGTHAINAVYASDANNAVGNSSILTLTIVAKTAATVALTSSLNPSTNGQSVTFTAHVTPSAATGTVLFVDGSVGFGTAVITGGTATITTSTLPIDIHSIFVVYSGDVNYATSTSSPLTQTVSKTPTTVTLTSSPNPANEGQTVTLTAVVSPGTATGLVQFFEGAAGLGTVTMSGGSASLTLSPQTYAFSVGTHAINAVYASDANNAVGNSSILTLTIVAKTATSVSLTSSLNPSANGQSVTFTAHVTPSAATGTVLFVDGSVSFGSAVVSGGTASIAISSLPVDIHSIFVVYSGDVNYATSTSSPLTQTVSKTPTSVALTSSPNPATVGQTVTLVAAVSPGTATGLVQFFEGAALLGTVTASGGSASLTLSAQAYAFSVGAHSITANYNGDANNAFSTSAILTQTVNKNASSVALTSSLNPSTNGQSVSFTATVSPSSATGTVQFLDGSTALGTATISGGSAALSLSSLPAGAHSIAAIYSGDGNNAASTSAMMTQTVNKQASSVALTSSLNPSTYGQSVGFTATVSPTSATGTVQFLDGSTALGTATISGGSAALSLSSLPAGAHSITAVYSGDGSDAASTSVIVTQTVNKKASSVALTSSLNPSTNGQSVSFTATVSPSSATGTVQFEDGSTALGTATLSGGTAALSLSSLSVGAHSITATYSGDGNDAASTSATMTQTVNKKASSVALASSLNPSISGQSVSFTATVSPISATGTVQFLDGSTALGTVAISGGSAALPLSTLLVGAHSITGVYSGDANDAATTSAILTQTVSAALPGAPTNLTATAASASQITLSWTASPTAGVTYNIYSAATSGVTSLAANRIASGVTATTYSNSGLPASTTRYYIVTAQKSAAESTPSNQATATTGSGAACHVTYTVTTQWNVGFGTAVTIKNTGTTPINGWNLTWTWAGNQQITQSWNSNYSQTGANGKLTNASWNAAIAAGATISGMGFNASYSGTNSAPAAFYLNGALCN